MRKIHLFSLILIVAVLTTSCSSIQTNKSINQKLKIGDYIELGSYNGEKILWRIVGDSENEDVSIGETLIGKPLLLSDKVITFKEFDYRGKNVGNNSSHGVRIYGISRKKTGSNYWGDSNLRSWLNSTETGGKVKWQCGNPPVKTINNYYPYDKESGFLSIDNFTSNEFNLINDTEHKIQLYNADLSRKDGGTERFRYSSRGLLINNLKCNFDDAYYELLSDRVFILDSKQLINLYKVFGDYYKTNSTTKALVKAGYTEEQANNELKKVAFYWINAAVDSWLPNSVLCVKDINSYGGGPDEPKKIELTGKQPDESGVGVRPALFLKNADRVTGSGTEKDPYSVIY